MKKFLSIYSTFILPLLSFSQVQITDFKNIEATSPSNFQFIDTLNNRLLYSTFIAERINQYVLWATDGTVENTKELKDENGENPANFYFEKIKLGRNLYIKDNGIWKTDGNKIEKIVAYSDSLKSIYKVGDKILVYFQKVIYKNLGGVILKDYLYWLDSQDKLSLFEKDNLTFKVINNELHYLKLNDSTQKIELHKYTKNKNELLASFDSVNKNIGRFEFFSFDDIDYYFLEISTQSQLISVNRTNKLIGIKEWGDESSSSYPLIIRDTLNNPYIFRVNNKVKIFSLQKESHLNLIVEASWNDVFKNVFKQSVEPSHYGWSITQIKFLGDKLIFVIYMGGEGLYAYYLNEYDFTTKTARVSKNLKNQLLLYDANRPTVKVLNEDEYEIDNALGKIFKYNFKKDTAVLISSYQYPPISKPDTGFIINNIKLLLQENLYKIIGKDTISMIRQKKVYSPYNSYGTNFLAKTLNDRLIFWNYDNETKQTKLWVSNGEKGGSEVLLSLSEQFPSFIDVYQNHVKIIANKAYFYTINAKEISIYVTDGTQNGTKKIWSATGSDYVYVDKVVANQSQLVYYLNIPQNNVYTKRIIVIENGVANEINNIPSLKFGFDIVLTQANVYVVNSGEKNGWSYQELYKLESTNLKLIDTETNDYKVYRDKLYYTKISYGRGTGYAGLYYYDEAKNQISLVTKNNIDEYHIYGNKLIFMTRTQRNTENLLTYTIKDMPSDNIDMTMSYTYPNNDLTSFNIQNIDDNSLIFSNYRKIIFIKNNEKREYDLKYKLLEPPRKYGKGILAQEVLESDIYTPIKLTYYDFSSNTITTILENEPHQPIFHNPNTNFILIPFAKNSNERTWKQWNHYTKTLQDLEGSFYQINCNSAFGVKHNGYETLYDYWDFDGKNLHKTYQIEGYVFNYLKRQEAYFSVKSPNIIALGKDSTISIARMVKENEGFNLYDIFQFKNQLYTYTFTYNEGYQVWKLPTLTNDKRNQLSQDCSSLLNYTDVLSTENNNVEINIFPNPASQNLYIGIEETTDYQIIDIKGSIIMKGKVSSTEPINISTLQPNIYFIQLQQEKFSFSRRFMKF